MSERVKFHFCSTHSWELMLFNVNENDEEGFVMWMWLMQYLYKLKSLSDGQISLSYMCLHVCFTILESKDHMLVNIAEYDLELHAGSKEGLFGWEAEIWKVGMPRSHFELRVLGVKNGYHFAHCSVSGL